MSLVRLPPFNPSFNEWEISPPALSSAPRPDELSFGFPANYGVGPSSATLMDPTGLFTSAPPFPPDLFPFAGLVLSWDSAPASSWLPELAQPSGIRYESLIRTPWDDSRCGKILIAPKILLTRKIHPFSIPVGDDWLSQGWSSDNSRPVSAAPSIAYGGPIGEREVSFSRLSLRLVLIFLIPSPPSVAVEIGPWIDTTSWTTVDPSVDSDINPVDQAQDIDAHLGWNSKPSARHPVTESVASGSSSLSNTGSRFQGDDPSHSYLSASVNPTAAVLPNHSNSSAQMLNPDALRQLARCCQIHWLVAVSDSLYSRSN
ncbi:hypothetical protein B0H16DRAFT_1563163 [Mycena metata]|uniref:Uncharacterized protein n=1 Tax=Mycena metata TaxID=1033252 RepID=A0AAD7IGI7_9AGAR|nr:hypothetical protein B0H16DRAFT_1563163 [Mycena metata]